MNRPRFTSPCVADRYANKSRERIAEFSFPGADGAGGLIALRYRDGQPPLVNVYRVEGCEVVTEESAGLNRIVNAALVVVDAQGFDVVAAITDLRLALAAHFPEECA